MPVVFAKKVLERHLLHNRGYSRTRPATVNFSSGPINVYIPDNSTLGVAHSIAVSLPANAVIYNMRVTINLSHTYMGDIRINLKAPNSQVLNLFDRHGSNGKNLLNTVISSQGTAAFETGSPPFTGTFKATARQYVGPTGYLSNAWDFADLYSVPSGMWTLALLDLAGGDVGLLTKWDISFNYYE
jgi:subtilisin-like proprotein convertase family protein